MPIDFNNAGGGERSRQVRDLYDLGEFEMLLNEAEDEALPGKQQDFVADMREKFELYRGQMYLSSAQHMWLKSIAGRD